MQRLICQESVKKSYFKVFHNLLKAHHDSVQRTERKWERVSSHCSCFRLGQSGCFGTLLPEESPRVHGDNNESPVIWYDHVGLPVCVWVMGKNEELWPTPLPHLTLQTDLPSFNVMPCFFLFCSCHILFILGTILPLNPFCSSYATLNPHAGN